MSKRNAKHERYVKLRYWLLNSPAWQSLPGNARALYVQIVQRYNGSNNGRIPYSCREAAQALHVGKGMAKYLLDVLQDRSFIACSKRGVFSRKATTREASEWRLTEYDNDVIAGHATKEFMRWAPSDTKETPEEFKTRFSHRYGPVLSQVRSGSPTGTVKTKKGPDRSPTGTVRAKNTPRPFSHRYTL